MRFKISYNYEVNAASKAEAKAKMAAAREYGEDEEYFTYVSIRPVDSPGLLNQVKQQLVG